MTKRKGCIEATAGCAAYQGTQEACAKFRGHSGTRLCWNLEGASSTKPCIEKVCSHYNSAKSNVMCEDFLPRLDGDTIP